MFHTLCFLSRSFAKVLGTLMFVGVFGMVTVRSQEAATERPVLDVEGNKVFSKQELLDVAVKCLDRIGESGKLYESTHLDYCLHLLTNHMRAKGYLQARLGKTL